MSLVKLLNLILFLFIFIAMYNIFFGIDSKIKFSALQNENQELLIQNKIIGEENKQLELEIQSKQKNAAHAEKFAREELNLIFEDEDFLRFKETKSNEPQG